MPVRGGDSPSQLHLVCLARRAGGRGLRRSASAVQGSCHELRTPLGVRQARLRDVLPEDARRHDDVRGQAKRARLPRAPAEGRALISELILECL